MRSRKAQTQMNKIWRHRHPAQARINEYRSSARTYVRHYADKQDMQSLNKLYRSVSKEDAQ